MQKVKVETVQIKSSESENVRTTKDCSQQFELDKSLDKDLVDVAGGGRRRKIRRRR